MEGKYDGATFTANVYWVLSVWRGEPEPDFGIDFPFRGRVLHTSRINPTITITVNASVNVRIKIARHCSWKEMHSRMSILLITVGLASNGRTMYPHSIAQASNTATTMDDIHQPRNMDAATLKCWPNDREIIIPINENTSIVILTAIAILQPITRTPIAIPLVGNTCRYMVRKDCDNRLCHREYQEHQ